MHGIDDVMMGWMWMDLALGACFYVGVYSWSKKNDHLKSNAIVALLFVIYCLPMFVFT